MDDVNVEESTDQPQEVEESNEDQPETESSEESEISEDEDQPEEESEEFVEIDGEEVPLAELKKGFMRNRDYTQKTQELAAQRKEIESMKQFMADSQGTKKVSPEQEKVFEFIKEYGLLTKEDFDKQLKVQAAKQADLQEYSSWKSSSGVDEKTGEAVYELGKAFPKLSYAEIHKTYFGDISRPKKVVKRRVVGVKGKGTGVKTGGAYTREKIAEIVKSGEYEKHRDKIMAAMSKGEINT